MTLQHAGLAICAAFLVQSCDVIERPYTESPVNPNPDTGVFVRQNIMLEDYTGHTCGTCPEAAEIAEQVVAAYGADRVIVVAVHAGPFAEPQPPDYKTDFRTPEGTLLDNTFRISRAGNPNGMVNRVQRNSRLIIGKDQWSTVVRDLADDTAKVALTVRPSYNAATRTVTAEVDVEYAVDGTPDYQLVAALVESGVISDQADYRKTPSHVPNYVFDHVLRAHFNGAWGEVLSTTNVAKGTKFTRTLTYVVPSDKTWNTAKCDVVVYVHRHGTARDVLQVEKKKLIP